jgi:hypothetical protein
LANQAQLLLKIVLSEKLKEDQLGRILVIAANLADIGLRAAQIL